MRLVLYGSFTCPYSFLASLRAGRLAASGAATVEWRAVIHDPSVPAEGKALEGELAHMFDRELDEIRALLAPEERYPARRPPVQPNTTGAVAGYCSLGGGPADELRTRLFKAFWVEGADIGSRSVLKELGCPLVAPGQTMQTWQEAWEATDRAVVPMMMLGDGQISRGLGALARLADFEAQSDSPIGGRRR